MWVTNSLAKLLFFNLFFSQPKTRLYQNHQILTAQH